MAGSLKANTTEKRKLSLLATPDHHLQADRRRLKLSKATSYEGSASLGAVGVLAKLTAYYEANESMDMLE